MGVVSSWHSICPPCFLGCQRKSGGTSCHRAGNSSNNRGVRLVKCALSQSPQGKHWPQPYECAPGHLGTASGVRTKKRGQDIKKKKKDARAHFAEKHSPRRNPPPHPFLWHLLKQSGHWKGMGKSDTVGGSMQPFGHASWFQRRTGLTNTCWMHCLVVIAGFLNQIILSYSCSYGAGKESCIWASCLQNLQKLVYINSLT